MKHGLDKRRFTTNLVFADGPLFTKMSAFTKVMSGFDWPWKGSIFSQSSPAFIRGRWDNS